MSTDEERAYVEAEAEEERRLAARSPFRKHIEDVVEGVLYEFDGAGYLSAEMRTEYTDRILDNIGWDGLMYLLNKHYPADVFRTGPDISGRDAGPRIVSLMRHLDAERQRVTWLDKVRITAEYAADANYYQPPQSTSAPGTRTGAEGVTDGCVVRPAP